MVNIPTSPANGRPGQRNGMYRNAHRYVLSLFIIVFAGFFKTYFSRLPSADLAHHLHAATAIAWMVLVVLQSYFITHGRTGWHRTFAKLSFVILPMLLITGLVMVYDILTRSPLTPGNSNSLFAFADFSSLLYLLILFAMGIAYRRDVRQHQRFMISTVFVLFPPALGRVFLFYVPLDWTVPLVLAAIYLFSLAIVVVLIVRDWLDEKTLYFAYGFSFAYFLVAASISPLLRHYVPWYHFCLWYTGQLH
ncbi:MAG: hypothetical protein PVJ40_10570 [Gammaproteobacteria bacterium]|jgi:hypothetical protein